MSTDIYCCGYSERVSEETKTLRDNGRSEEKDDCKEENIAVIVQMEIALLFYYFYLIWIEYCTGMHIIYSMLILILIGRKGVNLVLLEILTFIGQTFNGERYFNKVVDILEECTTIIEAVVKKITKYTIEYRRKMVKDFVAKCEEDPEIHTVFGRADEIDPKFDKKFQKSQMFPKDGIFMHYQRTIKAGRGLDKVLDLWDRVNATLPLIFTYLKKFTVREEKERRNVGLFSKGKTRFAKNCIQKAKQIISNPDVLWDIPMEYFIFDAKWVREQIEQSSAAGYKYEERGMATKRQAFDAAFAKYKREMEEGTQDPYQQTYWFLSTRAKLIWHQKPHSIRTIEYPGMDFNQLHNAWSFIVSRFFTNNVHTTGTAIGMSWFDAGGNKLFSSLLKGDKGTGILTKEELKEITQKRFVSYDQANWDTNVSSFHFDCLRGFMKTILTNIIEKNRYKDKDFDWEGWLKFKCQCIDGYYDQMSHKNRTVLFPNKIYMNLKHGMKSGCNLTSLDNSIIHICMIHGIEVRGKMVYFNVYGDDNISMFDTEEEAEEFARLLKERVDENLMEIKPGTDKIRGFDEVDFLSKKVKIENNRILPWRETIESYIRIVKPDTFLLDETGINGQRQRLERLYGHQIDNFNNEEARRWILEDIAWASKGTPLDIVKIKRQGFQCIHGLFTGKKDFICATANLVRDIEFKYKG